MPGVCCCWRRTGRLREGLAPAGPTSRDGGFGEEQLVAGGSAGARLAGWWWWWWWTRGAAAHPGPQLADVHDQIREHCRLVCMDSHQLTKPKHTTELGGRASGLQALVSGMQSSLPSQQCAHSRASSRPWPSSLSCPPPRPSSLSCPPPRPSSLPAESRAWAGRRDDHRRFTVSPLAPQCRRPAAGAGLAAPCARTGRAQSSPACRCVGCPGP